MKISLFGVVIGAATALAAGCSSSSSGTADGSAPGDDAASSSSGGEGGSGSSSGASSSGSSSGGQTDAGYGLLNCPSGQPLPSSCKTCIETMCSAPLSAVNAACGSYFSCVCPAGFDGGGCSAPATTCKTALGGLMTGCAACDSNCGGVASSGGSSGGSEAGAEGGAEGGPDGNADGGGD
jgi:hypothetical protein